MQEIKRIYSRFDTAISKLAMIKASTKCLTIRKKKKGTVLYFTTHKNLVIFLYSFIFQTSATSIAKTDSKIILLKSLKYLRWFNKTYKTTFIGLENDRWYLIPFREKCAKQSFYGLLLRFN